jgi:hypothetical protein
LFIQKSVQSLYEWQGIDAITETADGVFFLAANGSVCAVRNRAFASEEMKSRFVEEAHRYLNEARADAGSGAI